MSNTNATQQQLAPQQALEVLASACQQIKATFQEHSLLSQCVNVLAEAIAPKPAVERVERPSAARSRESKPTES